MLLLNHFKEIIKEIMCVLLLETFEAWITRANLREQFFRIIHCFLLSDIEKESSQRVIDRLRAFVGEIRFSGNNITKNQTSGSVETLKRRVQEASIADVKDSLVAKDSCLYLILTHKL